MNKAAPQNESQELSKSFEPAEIEARWYAEWERRGYFEGGAARVAGDETAGNYAIQFPRPT